MTELEAMARIQVGKKAGLDGVPVCGECGGWGLGYASVEHHHACHVAAAITTWTPILAGETHWARLGHEPRGADG